MTRRLPSTSRRRRGFSLLELAAAMAILALVASFVLPSMSISRGRSVKAAEQLAARLELARLRAVATGAPHRVVIDLDEQAYQLEWFVSEARALGDEEPEEPDFYDVADGTEVVMTAPPSAERTFHPLLGSLGDWEMLLEDVVFDAVETPTGQVSRGRVEIVFHQDGTTDATQILLSDAGGSTATLEVEPLAHQIRILREQS
jgi:prepilin-type N-terminal cleavage/methylation domain-containing protein